jgi:hypothetical protein
MHELAEETCTERNSANRRDLQRSRDDMDDERQKITVQLYNLKGHVLQRQHRQQNNSNNRIREHNVRLTGDGQADEKAQATLG